MYSCHLFSYGRFQLSYSISKVLFRQWLRVITCFISTGSVPLFKLRNFLVNFWHFQNQSRMVIMYRLGETLEFFCMFLYSFSLANIALRTGSKMNFIHIEITLIWRSVGSLNFGSAGNKCDVIYQKRVRVFHQGFQTPRK